jgi:hypothetical protein
LEFQTVLDGGVEDAGLRWKVVEHARVREADLLGDRRDGRAVQAARAEQFGSRDDDVNRGDFGRLLPRGAADGNG